MAFVRRLITVGGLHGGGSDRPDPSPHRHQLQRCNYTLTSGLQSIYPEG